MKRLAATVSAMLLGPLPVVAAPFDNVPTFPCGLISKFEVASLEGAKGPELFAIWLSGFASGAVAVSPELADGAVPNLPKLLDLVSKICDENPNGELSASVLNRLLETID